MKSGKTRENWQEYIDYLRRTAELDIDRTPLSFERWLQYHQGKIAAKIHIPQEEKEIVFLPERESLTPVQYISLHLIQEMSELTKDLTKSLIYGWESKGRAEGSKVGIHRVIEEAADVEALLNRLWAVLGYTRYDNESYEDRIQDKIDKVIRNSGEIRTEGYVKYPRIKTNE